MLQEMGYSKADAKRMAQQENLNNTINTIRRNAATQAKEFGQLADDAMAGVQADIEQVAAVQEKAANNTAKTTSSSVNAQEKEIEAAAEYYKGVLKQLADFEDKELTKTARGRIAKLEAQKAEELAKYTLNAEQRAKVEELYAKRIQEIRDEEARRVQQSIAAAYAVQVEQQLKLMAQTAKTGIRQQEGGFREGDKGRCRVQCRMVCHPQQVQCNRGTCGTPAPAEDGRHPKIRH